MCSLATAAQLAAVAALGWRFAACLPVAWLLQTLAFVAFNKVGAYLRNIDACHPTDTEEQLILPAGGKSHETALPWMPLLRSTH